MNANKEIAQKDGETAMKEFSEMKGMIFDLRFKEIKLKIPQDVTVTADQNSFEELNHGAKNLINEGEEVWNTWCVFGH